MDMLSVLNTGKMVLLQKGLGHGAVKDLVALAQGTGKPKSAACKLSSH